MSETVDVLDAATIAASLATLGLPSGAVVIVHASLSALGTVRGGAPAVLDALLQAVGDKGTVVVPTFTPQVCDPYPERLPAGDACIDGERERVPLFDHTTPTPMGAVPQAVLAHARHHRSRHPQASVAAIGARAREITVDHPLSYALGKHSPFERLHGMQAHILLLGVGHNRNSFLHYAESLSSRHRIKRRRFPTLIHGERGWMDVPDVGDDNGVLFPRAGQAASDAGLVQHGVIGSAACQLMQSQPFVAFAARRLDAWLADARC